MNAKKKIFLLLFSFEITIVLLIFGFGIPQIISLTQENERIRQEIKTIQQEIESLEHTIDQWNTHAFYKEKVAREQLQMARKNESIYYFS